MKPTKSKHKTKTAKSNPQQGETSPSHLQLVYSAASVEAEPESHIVSFFEQYLRNLETQIELIRNS